MNQTATREDSSPTRSYDQNLMLGLALCSGFASVDCRTRQAELLPRNRNKVHAPAVNLKYTLVTLAALTLL